MPDDHKPPTIQVVATHRAATHPLTVNGVGTAVLDIGPRDAPAVVCAHGVPSSAFLYRNVVRELAANGLRGIAIDLPGLGLADRPVDFDYTWTGLGRYLTAAIDALGLRRFHLVVHDIGGPVGFEVAAAVPERVASLTVLNHFVDVDRFRRPWMMAPFALRGIGEAWLRGMQPPIFRRRMRRIGIWRPDATSNAELDAHLELLLLRVDGGRAFLKIMRGFELTSAKQRLYRQVVGDTNRPRLVLWGEHDAALPAKTRGRQAAEPAGVLLQTVPGRHFLQEDNAPAIAAAIADLITSA